MNFLAVVEDRDNVSLLNSNGRERRLNRRNSKIMEVQETLSRLADSLAVLLPTVPDRKSDSVLPKPQGDEALKMADAPSEVIIDSLPAVRQTVTDKSVTSNDSESKISCSAPQAKTILLQVNSNWGDECFVGLNGLDIYDTKGRNVKVKSIALQSSSEVEPIDCKSDDEAPGGVHCLVDGIHSTRDDFHIWLHHLHEATNNSMRMMHKAEDDDGEPPSAVSSSSSSAVPLCIIRIELFELTAISLIVVWNYNKGRTYRSRGVKGCNISLDSRVVFDGLQFHIKL